MNLTLLVGECRLSPERHLAGVRIGPGHLDQRRRLRPQEYVVDAWRFGVDRDAPMHIPEGGDEVSLRIAQLQHQLVCQWTADGRRVPTAALCRRFEMSKQTFSKVVTGQRWAGETVLAALVSGLVALAGGSESASEARETRTR